MLGRKLLASFEEAFDLGDGRSTEVGATIGYALSSELGCDTGRLLRGADAAMYAGKQAGKHRVMTLEPVRPAAESMADAAGPIYGGLGTNCELDRLGEGSALGSTQSR